MVQNPSNSEHMETRYCSLQFRPVEKKIWQRSESTRITATGRRGPQGVRRRESHIFQMTEFVSLTRPPPFIPMRINSVAFSPQPNYAER
jgi:hypothetical protein